MTDSGSSAAQPALPALTGISSMATRAVLAELLDAYPDRHAVRIDLISIGGVDAARRVEAGEAFDWVALASDVIDRQIAAGWLRPGRFDLVRSEVAVAVRSGAPHPDLSHAEAVQAALRTARSIGISTGPSGLALKALFGRWGLLEQIEPRLVTATPGVPVGQLVAEGRIELGFQQLSELIALPGIELISPLAPEIAITTMFSAAICARSTQVDATRALLDYLVSPATAALKQQYGMSAA